MPLRVLITGSGGIVGRHVVRAFQDTVPDAEILRNTADLTDLAATTRFVEDAGWIDLVLHLAALVPVAEVQANPARAYCVNVGGTANLLSALADTAARVLLVSSSHVYASKAEPIVESDPTVPVSLYGQTKLMAEQAATQICEATGRSLCLARLFSIHDPRQTGSYLRPTLERRFAEMRPDTPFELFGAGSLRDFLPAQDAARLLVKLALTGAEGAVNVASGTAITVADFARSLAPVPLDIRPKGQDDILKADVTRLRAILGENNA